MKHPTRLAPLLLLALAFNACNISETGQSPAPVATTDSPGVPGGADFCGWQGGEASRLGNGLPKTNFVHLGYKWNKTNLTYSLSGSFDSRAQALFAMAATAISSVVPLTFQLISDPAAADIPVTFHSQAYMGSNAGMVTPEAGYTPTGEYVYQKAPMKLGYFGGKMARHDNYFLYVTMHELGHAVGLKHTPVENTLMYAWMYDDGAGNHMLYFLQNDDIQGLQSLYGSVPPKYPSWDHRYTIRTKTYVSSSPYPGTPPIGWVYTSDSYPTWPTLGNRFHAINTDQFRVTITP